MTTDTSVIIQLPTVSPTADIPAYVDTVRAVVALAESRGADAVLIPHAVDALLDPAALAGLLSAEAHGVPLLIEAQTGRHAPFNLARRVQALARITGGRAGVLLRDTGVDPVTASARPHVAAAEGVIGEYARVLRLLWDSFPEQALLGDRDAGLLADVDLIRPARHQGDVYGVEGAINIPIAPEQRPVLLVDAGAIDDPDVVDAIIGTTTDAVTPAYRPLTWSWSRGGFAQAPEPDGGILLAIDAPLGDVVAQLTLALDELNTVGPSVDDPSLWRRRTATAVA